jgi:hypothetical protein
MHTNNKLGALKVSDRLGKRIIRKRILVEG